LNYAAAYEWFIKASDHNFPPSLYMLGLMYHQGHSVAINFERARVWFLKAAKLGSANAQFMYAFMLQSAEGGPSESDKAMVWAILSGKNGKEDAVAITVPAGMNMTQLEIETAEKIASECLSSSYAECPE
jgi:hypothetical protein